MKPETIKEAKTLLRSQTEYDTTGACAALDRGDVMPAARMLERIIKHEAEKAKNIANYSQRIADVMEKFAKGDV